MRAPRYDRLGERTLEARSARLPCDVLFDGLYPVQGVVDALIAGATAEVALEHARQVRERLLVESRGRHDHAGRTEAALKRLRVEKGLLHRMQPAVLLEPLDRRDRASGGAKRRHQATVERRAVEPNCAGPAVA